MSWPRLPPKAAYLVLNPGHNTGPANHRNALSVEVLRNLKAQLIRYNTTPTRIPQFLPKFKPSTLNKLEQAHTKLPTYTDHKQHGWLVNSKMWNKTREGLPNVLVLRSEGPVFCSGHDLEEIHGMGHAEASQTFALFAEVMGLIRRSPAIVISVIQGSATAAGAQLALTADLSIACASAQFRLPGASIGLPCSSPSTALSRTLGNAFTYRMLALAEPVRADQLPGGVVETVPEDALESRVAEIVDKLACQTPGQPQALGKWAYWTQAGMIGAKAGASQDELGGDGYTEAANWTARVMALQAKTADADEGMMSSIENRKPRWKT